MQNPTALSDQILYELCQKYGTRALHWRRKFIGLLPEVNRRRLYVAKGFNSIFEFAAKLAGISEEQVTEVLRLERKLADKPALHSQLISGEVTHHKIARVAAIATPQTAEFWATQTITLSRAALDTMVKDEKTLQNTLSGRDKQKILVQRGIEVLAFKFSQ